MANFPKSHGLEIRQNGYIKNASIEEFDIDPTVLNNSGRLWFNTTDKRYKGTFRDSDNNIVIKQFPTLEDLESAVSGAAITVSDEGGVISTTVNKINFVGADIQAMSDDGKEVTVYVPTPTFTSHWNTSDGTVASNIISDITTTSRYIAAPTSEGTPYKIGNWIAGSLHTVITSTTLTYTSPSLVCFDNLTSSFTVNVLDADNTTILASNTLTDINNNITNTTNNITITLTNWTSQYNKYKANVSISINIPNILPTGGRFSISMVHHSTNTYTKSQNDLFYDLNSTTPIISTLNISQNTLSTTKYLSGIRYYSIGDSFNISISDIDNINDSTYPSNLITLETNNYYGITDYSLTTSDLTSWTNLYNNTNSSYSGTKSISRTSFRNIGSTRIDAYPIDYSSGKIYSGYSNVLIDTYTSTSTDTNEDFIDENKRLTSSWTAWSSLNTLSSTDLQIINGTLRRQYGDWTGYFPVNTSNYSSTNTSTQYYYRQFRVSGVAHSNGIFSISGCTQANLDSNTVLFEISLDGSNWYNCNTLYTGGALTNGAGCRINKDTNVLPKLEFTLGTGGSTSVSTGPLGWGIYVRVSMPSGSTVQLTNFDMTNW